MSKNKPTNYEIADVLGRIADLLEVQNANPHRVRAYRSGAERVRNLDMSLTEMIRSGDGKALQKLPDIGEGLAQVISNYVHKGRSDVLDRLQGEISPEDLFAQVPGIGQTLAERIADQLDINTLEELERSAYDGRLAKVKGFGTKRLRTVQFSLSGMLSRAAQRRARQRTGDQKEQGQEQPEVETLLEVDAEYRRKAEANELHKISPKCFNPEGDAWLPIFHTSRNDWDFTVLFSNTARAHKLGKTHDWVVIYYEQNGQEDQATIVTSHQGQLKGERIVRGRESDCEQYYEKTRKLAS